MSKANKINLSEDWIATIIGLLVIVIAVTAFVSVGWAATPVKYAWNGLSELGNVFANQNLAHLPMDLKTTLFLLVYNFPYLKI